MYRATRPVPRTLPLRIPDDAGVQLPEGAATPKSIQHLERVTRGEPRTVYPFTLWWDPAAPIRVDLVPAGFNFLRAGWHVAAPLYDYNTLAFQLGTLEEREKTAAIVRDLRQPVYETRALFLRQCPETDALLEAWAQERAGGDERLAFQRAAWAVKPLILPLPITWIEGKHV